MRRLCILALLFVAACGAQASGGRDGGVVTTPGSATSVPSAPPAAPAGSSPASTTSATAPTGPNPCQLVTEQDLRQVFAHVTAVSLVTDDGYDPSNPPANGPFGERNCAYEVTVSGVFGSNPTTDSTATVTVIVTTYAEDGTGTVWNALVDGAKAASIGPNAVPYRRVVGIGDGAFYGATGDLTARKGSTVVYVWSVDDVNGVLGDRQARSLVLRALAH